MTEETMEIKGEGSVDAEGNIQSTVTEVKKEPELTPEQLADRTAKRLIFRQIHDVYAATSSVEASDDLMELGGLISEALQKEEAERLISTVKVELTEKDEQKKKVLELLATITAKDAGYMIGAIGNAIAVHTRMKMKPVTVKELEFKLLD